MAQKKTTMFGEFKDFILRGNVVDLAVAVVIGAAFGQVVKDVVDILTNIPAIAGKHTQFVNLACHIRGGTFAYGPLIHDLITFVIVAAAIFLVVVKPMNYIAERRRRGVPEPESDDRPCPYCLSSIPKAASRCAFCTAEVPVAA
jgi:large conductance mechanosensitive channel